MPEGQRKELSSPELEERLPKFDLSGYTRIRKLDDAGEGMAGEVHLYKSDKKNPPFVAVKISKESRTEIFREASRLLENNLPGVVKCFGITEVNGRGTLVEEALIKEDGWTALNPTREPINSFDNYRLLSTTKAVFEVLKQIRDSPLAPYFEIKGALSFFLREKGDEIEIKAIDFHAEGTPEQRKEITAKIFANKPFFEMVDILSKGRSSLSSSAADNYSLARSKDFVPQVFHELLDTYIAERGDKLSAVIGKIDQILKFIPREEFARKESGREEEITPQIARSWLRVTDVKEMLEGRLGKRAGELDEIIERLIREGKILTYDPFPGLGLKELRKVNPAELEKLIVLIDLG